MAFEGYGISPRADVQAMMMGSLTYGQRRYSDPRCRARSATDAVTGAGPGAGVLRDRGPACLSSWAPLHRDAVAFLVVCDFIGSGRLLAVLLG